MVVNSKYLFQFIVYLLLGVMAMADPGEPAHAHTGDFIANDIGASAKIDINDNCDPIVYAHTLMHRKRSVLKVRFRAESSFRKGHTDAGRLVNAAFPVTITTLQTRKTTHITPFYYVFLFRLTPF